MGATDSVKDLFFKIFNYTINESQNYDDSIRLYLLKIKIKGKLNFETNHFNNKLIKETLHVIVITSLVNIQKVFRSNLYLFQISYFNGLLQNFIICDK